MLPIPLQKVIDEATAVCDIRKFSDYIFNPEYDDNGKRALFESWGFSILDAETLQKEFERLALDQYITGQYKLGKLDDKGQRISIVIELKRKDKEETVTVKSGWMVDPEGKIHLATPLAGGKKK